MLLARLPETNGVQQAWREITAEEIDAGPVAVDFTVPAEIALEAGADAPFDIAHHPSRQCRISRFRLGIDLLPAR